MNNKSNTKNENYKDFCDYLTKSLDNYDLIDLLEKLSCTRFFIKTSFLICDYDNRMHLVNVFNEAFCFLLPFLMSHKINYGQQKIKYKEFFELCNNISKNFTAGKFDNIEYIDGYNDKIDYIQNNLTDLIGPFKKIPVNFLLSCEEKLIKAKYDITIEDIVAELIEAFQTKICLSIMKEKPIELKDFINSFEEYVATDSFKILQGNKTYELCKDLSIDFGEIEEEKFSYYNPLSVINLSRKLFIYHDGFLFNFCDDLICGRLNRSIESLFVLQSEKDEWRKNYKKRTEDLVKELFEYHLIGGKYFENNYYKNDRGYICENDGLYIYHNYIFCIEIKGNKFNPDPIMENTENVRESYNQIITKAEEQVLRIEDLIIKNKKLEILDNKGNILDILTNLEDKSVINLCVYFEDIGTLLSGLEDEQKNIIHISFYDLLLVFEMIDNPFLIVKYLEERSSPLHGVHYYINDELIFLNLFMQNIHLNSFLNAQKIDINIETNPIVAIDDGFAAQIESYFINRRNKPKVELNNFIRKIITFKDYSTLDDNLFTGLVYILDQPNNILDNLEKRFKIKNNSKRRLPFYLFVENVNNDKYALMFISRAHNPFQKKQNLGFIKKYFEYREDLKTIYLLEVGKDYTECSIMKENDACLDDIDLKSLLLSDDISIVSSDEIRFE